MKMHVYLAHHMINNHTNKIGLGCVTFGREIDQTESFKILDKAYGCGITFFDTASAYGEGASETIVGNWISSRRPPPDSFIVATKILPPFDPGGIAKSVYESMKRLNTNTIDLLYLHRWDQTIETPGSLAAFDQLLGNGQIRMLGASNFTSQQLRKALYHQQQEGFQPFRYVQNNHNLAVSDIDNDFRDICVKNGIEIISYSPLGAGFLTGKHQKGVIAGSRFDLLPAHQSIYFEAASQSRLEKLREVAGRIGCTPSHLALAWALHQPGISKVLIGARNIGHLEQAITALAFNDINIFAELES